MSKFKIGFVPHQSIDRKQTAAGTRIRVLNIVKYLDNAILSYDFEDLKDCDVVIFQARWLATDIGLAKKLYKLGIKLLFDTTDPHWDIINFDTSQKRKEALEQILEYIDVLTFPTEELKNSFLSWRQDKRVEIIPDNIDLEKHTATKVHKDREIYTICWYGCRSNVCQIDLARSDLEKLGLEFKLRFIAVYDTRYGIKLIPPKNVEYIEREWTDEITIQTILESDVVINPRYDNWKRYKSNNKTIKALALGVPCVERNFYSEIKRYLLSAELRNEVGRKGKEIAKDFDSKIIAKRLLKLCTEIRKTSYK